MVPEIDRIVSSVSEERTFIVIDGYHAFMARPVNIGAIQDRVFYLAGGYKYAMSGEGVCFLHSPPGYGPRPLNTGWYAGFGQLETGVSETVPYAQDGTRFGGATTDPSGVYRLRSVLSWLAQENVTADDVSSHVHGLQDHFMANVEPPGDLTPPDGLGRGNFLTFETPEAEAIYERLHERKVITDFRGERLRIGFGIYHDEADVDDLLKRLNP